METMNKNENAVALLQGILSGVLGGAQMHYIHAKINEQSGYVKLAARMLEEYEEEMASVATIIAHIRRLGGEPRHEVELMPVYSSVEEQIRKECEMQVAGVAALEVAIKQSETDIVTENYLMDYLEEETDHANWLRQQVQLIDGIGIQNYLAKQI